MVYDTIDIAADILDFHLDTSTSKQLQQQQHQQQPNQNLPHSSSNSTLKIPTTKKQQKVFDQLLVNQERENSTNLPFLPRSAENLSWTFFEHVSTLDNQLRGDEELSSPPTNGCHLMTTSPAHTQGNTVTGPPANCLEQPQETIARNHQQNFYNNKNNRAI
uniref:Uncharacterized protein n=1 Tax=Ceratitis capitata TaxID=7213 RepID=W8BAR4_CERCA